MVGINKFPPDIPKYEETKPIFYVPPQEKTKPQPIEYYPTYFEWLFTRGQQIIKSSYNQSSTPETLYTIPKGYIFLLDTLIFNHSDRVVGGGISAIGVYLSNSTATFLVQYGNPDVANTTDYTQTINYNPPLIIQENVSIILQGYANIDTCVFLKGILIPK